MYLLIIKITSIVLKFYNVVRLLSAFVVSSGSVVWHYQVFSPFIIVFILSFIHSNDIVKYNLRIEMHQFSLW